MVTYYDISENNLIVTTLNLPSHCKNIFTVLGQTSNNIPWKALLCKRFNLLQKDSGSFEIISSSACRDSASIAVDAVDHRDQVYVGVLFTGFNVAKNAQHLVEVLIVVDWNCGDGGKNERKTERKREMKEMKRERKEESERNDNNKETKLDRQTNRLTN